MWKEKFILIALFISYFVQINSYTTSDPIWLTSPYFRAGNDKVISSMTGNTSTPTYTFTFSSPLSGVPNLAYGVKNYRGNDTLLNEMFEIRRVSLTASTFTVSMQIYGYTNIYLFTVPYLAIDPAFPHHLNSFDNVPLNHSSGPLTNLSVNTTATTSHTQYINYTQQAAANTYKTFQLPLGSNKMVLFLSSVFVLSSGSAFSPVPLQLDISYEILNTSHYKWSAKLYQRATITRLHFSQIVYNEDDVKSSKLYSIVYEEWIIGSNGGYKEFPQQLVDNMILALTDFHSINGRCGLEYNWQFVSNYNSTPYGIYLNQSNPSNYNCGLSRARSILFYIKTWQCAAPFIYYNLTSDKCQNGCADYYYQNTTAKECDSCYYGCIDCSQGGSSTACTQCQTGTYRSLVNNSCVCDSGYFDDGHNAFCRACSAVDTNCQTCTYTLDSSQPQSYYQGVFSSSTWKVDILPQYTCSLCVSNYFVNSSGLCQTCSINYCSTCASITQCSVCNSTASAVKYTNNLCYLCTIGNCIMCSSDNVCTTCDTGFVLSGGACLTCNQTCTCDGWVLPKVNGTCSTLCGDGYMVGGEQCDDNNTIDHDGCSSICKIQTCAENCSCDGWVMPWGNGSCSTVCGDTYLRGTQQCDDGNTIDHDGCSSICIIQTCSENCSCDGWIFPWTNGSCQTICGDGYLRGVEQCDDGNTIDHDGCSSVCIIQSCAENCSCDGWAFPLVNDSCSPICGDELLRGEQQCDDGNILQGDGCNINCVIQIKNNPILLTQSQTSYASLGLFILGFKIVGLQMLNTFQNFQLLLTTYNVQSFQMSYYIHGYTNESNFPFEVSFDNQIYTHFNFMFLGILALFAISVMMELCTFCFRRNNKIKNMNDQPSSRKNTFQFSESQSSGENHSDQSDFAVHYHNNKQKLNSTHHETINQKDKCTSSNLMNLGSILLRQIFFDLLINCQYIFIFSLVKQAKQYSISSFLNFTTIITVGSMVLLLFGFLAFYMIDSPLFGQNQMKFHKNKWMTYWMISIGQRVIFSSLLNYQADWALFAMLALKLIIICLFAFSQIFYEKIQKIRNLSIHVLHLMLLGTFTSNHLYFQNSQIKQQLPELFIEYIYSALLGLILFITIAFYVRQFMYSCSADYRKNKTQQLLMTQSQGIQSAIFDPRNEEILQQSAHNFNRSKYNPKSIKNIFQDMKSNKQLPNFQQEKQSNLAKSHISSKTKKNIQNKSFKNIDQMNGENGKKDYQTHKRSNVTSKKTTMFNCDQKIEPQDDYEHKNTFNANATKTKSFMKSFRRIGLNNNAKNQVNSNSNKNSSFQEQAKHNKSQVLDNKSYLKTQNAFNKQVKLKTFYKKTKMNIVNTQNQYNDGNESDNYDAVSIHFD